MSIDAEKVGPQITEDVAHNETTKLTGDYAGAVRKTDKREIALVRKLDMRIMPALFCMYFL